ncbi:MAG: hypothetical protein JRF33_14220 [Deltaproteobacteria bacterium]|nr:hypothetical protein [Deltaproteobacteria bacterium]
MDNDNLDAGQLADKILKILDKFDDKSGLHRKDESFVALDANRYELTIKLLSPFGQGLSREMVESTNELQQRVNHWMGMQRALAQLGSVRLIITPIIEDNE